MNPESEYESASRKAVSLFMGTALVAAVTVGAMLIAGWGAGRLDNRIEWVFWAGAILGAIGIGLLGIATMPVPRSPSVLGTVRGLTRAGTALFLIAPVLCVVAVFTDYWI